LANLLFEQIDIAFVHIVSEFKFARTFCLLFGPSKSRPPKDTQLDFDFLSREAGPPEADNKVRRLKHNLIMSRILRL
jgi:hypothetical protein